MACRLGFSIMLLELFKRVANLTNANNLRDSYILVTFCGILWYIGQIFRHNAYYQVPILVGKIRSLLILLIFTKLSTISQYTAKAQELGKIINLLSNDFNTI